MLSVVPQIRLNRSSATIEKWGIIDGYALRPGDTLQLGPASDGDLLLLLPKGAGHPMVGRYFGRTLLSEPHGSPVSERRWRVLAGVKAISRPMSTGPVGKGPWFIRLEGGPAELQEHLHNSIESKAVDEIYLSDFIRRVLQKTPNAKIIVSHSSENLKQNIVDCLPGHVLYLPRNENYASTRLLQPDWMAAKKRQQRREMRQKISSAKMLCALSPLPMVRAFDEGDRLASK